MILKKSDMLYKLISITPKYFHLVKSVFIKNIKFYENTSTYKICFYMSTNVFLIF